MVVSARLCGWFAFAGRRPTAPDDTSGPAECVCNRPNRGEKRNRHDLGPRSQHPRLRGDPVSCRVASRAAAVRARGRISTREIRGRARAWTHAHLRSRSADGARIPTHRHDANSASQKIITKDNVSIDIAAVAYYHISDPEKAVIVIENVYNAINQISQTTVVRNVVGRFSLDQGFYPTPRASTCKSRTSSTVTRSRGAPR